MFEWLAVSIVSLVLLPLLLFFWLTPRRAKMVVLKRLCYATIALVLAFFFALAVLLIFADMALSFPELATHGYSSCSSCHIAPSGGGALNPYGRSAGSSFISMNSGENEEQALFGAVNIPDWIGLGGDIRYININTRAPGYEHHEKFPMQEDLELAVITPYITVGGSVGEYGPEQTREFRRSYIKVPLGERFSVRAGRFMPAYGINFPDHTLPTRTGMGFGQDQETYNLEGTALFKYGELIVTGINGSKNSLGLQSDGAYSVTTDSDIGFSARGTYFLGERSQVGVSILRLSSPTTLKQAGGVFAIVSLPYEAYVLSEFDRKQENNVGTNLATTKLGWEVTKGLYIYGLHLLDTIGQGTGVGVQWFPRPHFEFTAELRRIFSNEQGGGTTGLLMFHYYL